MEMREDCDPDTGFCLGHRASGSNRLIGDLWLDAYLPDRATGCLYRATDYPGWHGVNIMLKLLGGDDDYVEYHISERFLHNVVDVCDSYKYNVVASELREYDCFVRLNKLGGEV